MEVFGDGVMAVGLGMVMGGWEVFLGSVGSRSWVGVAVGRRGGWGEVYVERECMGVQGGSVGMIWHSGRGEMRVGLWGRVREGNRFGG